MLVVVTDENTSIQTLDTMHDLLSMAGLSMSNARDDSLKMSYQMMTASEWHDLALVIPVMTASKSTDLA